MPIITISRGSMSGGKDLAECISASLGCPCIGREIVVEAASKLGVPQQVLARKMEKRPGLWDRLTLERRIYLVAVQAALAEHALAGDLVYHGLAGHMLLRDLPSVLRIRLIAPLEVRIRTVMERQKLSRQTAEHYIHDVDEERMRWTKFIYDVDLTDARLYDMIINLEGMSIPTACSAVLEIIKKPEFTITDSVRKSLADFSLACRVKVAFATHPASRGLDLQVTANEGIVSVVGEVPQPIMLTHASSRWEQELTQIAESVEGVSRVDLSIRAFDAYH
jgi:cytidylate kinase